jgi:hypothetical protein
VGADEYKTLFRKYVALERSMGTNNQVEEEEEQQRARSLSARSSLANVDEQVKQCPVCYWEFPTLMTIDGKREHIEKHF